MSDLERYLAFAREHPALFANPAGAIFTILLDAADIRRAEAEAAKQLQAKGMPTEWAQVGTAFQDQYLFLLRDAVRYPDGSLGTYIRFVDPDGNGTPGVIVLPVYQGQVILIRHFRHATRTWHLEIPRGFSERGLSGEENARKELEEEIGGVPSRLIALGQIYPDSGISSQRNEIFYAEVASYTQPDAHEAIAQMLLVSVDEFERLMRKQEITDGFTLMAYARAKLHGLM